MIDRNLMRELLGRALARGGEYADVYVALRRSTALVLDEGKMEKALAGSTLGVGIRLITGGKTSLAASSDLSPEVLREMASGLASAASGGASGLVADFRCARPGAMLVADILPDGVPITAKVAMLREADREARARGPEVRQVSVTYRDSVERVRIACSDGAYAEDERVHTLAMVHVVAERDGVVQTGYAPVAGCVGYEIFNGEPLAEKAREAAGRAIALLAARRAPGGRMPVVISSRAGGTMIHEAIGHGLEADLALQGLSRFSGRMGERVASPLVTVIDDATLPGRRGSYGFDDEGVPSERTMLVDRGILTGYLTDRLSAMRAGGRSTGNGRRESYRHRPIPRMSNTFIAPGEDDPVGILGSTDRGLFVTRMGGGQVNTVTGEFVFDVQEGYLIENGRQGDLVRGATLSGSGPEVLMSIDMVGSDLGFSIGTCGKDGQGVPVSDALPTLRVPDMVVGGAT
jgi:TldD protein